MANYKTKHDIFEKVHYKMEMEAYVDRYNDWWCEDDSYYDYDEIYRNECIMYEYLDESVSICYAGRYYKYPAFSKFKSIHSQRIDMNSIYYDDVASSRDRKIDILLGIQEDGNKQITATMKDFFK